jgi:hypothetical protein
VDYYEVEEHGEDEGGRVAVCDAFSGWRSRGPGWAEDAGFDGGVDFRGMGFCVGDEELGIELREDVSDTVGFVGELDAEECFEEGEKLRCDIGLEGGHVGKRQEEADGLCLSALYNVRESRNLPCCSRQPYPSRLPPSLARQQ